VRQDLARLRVVFAGLSVLVVDDDLECRDACRYLLEEFGATVLVASDGIEALAVLREHAPDLMLSDMAMPRLDGYALVRQVRNDPVRHGLPMVAVSASFAAADQHSEIPEGADAALGKPFDYRDLDRTLQQVMFKRPRAFKRQRTRLRVRATAECAHARELQAKARLLCDALARRRDAGQRGA
jgi:CheY-like chemotaxis protein